jgi:hypothetical protein
MIVPVIEHMKKNYNIEMNSKVTLSNAFNVNNINVNLTDNISKNLLVKSNVNEEILNSSNSL